MGNIKKGQITRPPQYWKHLRDYKKIFWGAERQAGKAEAQKQLRMDEASDEKDGKNHRCISKKKPKKRFGMEYRIYEKHRQSCAFLFERRAKWTRHWGWYATAAQRDQAMENLSNKSWMNYGPLYEYRPIER